jgi:hypothetical protein
MMPAVDLKKMARMKRQAIVGTRLTTQVEACGAITQPELGTEESIRFEAIFSQ